MDFSKYKPTVVCEPRHEIKERFQHLYDEVDTKPLTKKERQDEYQKISNLIETTFEKSRKDFRDQEVLLRRKFFEDARQELGYEHLPPTVRDLIENQAYREGHSHGYSEIFNYIQEYLEFTKEIMKALEEEN